MLTINYTPTRKIVGDGGVINTEVTDFTFAFKEHGKHHSSLSGVSEGVLFRLEDTFHVSVKPFKDASLLDYWREFAASTNNNEQFSITSTNIPGAPAAANCELVRGSYKESITNPSLMVTFQIKIK